MTLLRSPAMLLGDFKRGCFFILKKPGDFKKKLELQRRRLMSQPAKLGEESSNGRLLEGATLYRWQPVGLAHRLGFGSSPLGF